MIDSDIAAAEILQGVKSQIGIPCTATAVDDGFPLWVETRRAEYALNAIRRDEILVIFVAQNFGRIADVNRTSNVCFGIGISKSLRPKQLHFAL
jgi:hypothetical protein